MGGGQLKLESIDGDEAFFRCSADQMARKNVRVFDLLKAQSKLQLERWLME